MFSKRHKTYYGESKLPPWLIFLLGVASVFGLYYLGAGIRNFVSVGGRDVLVATEQAVIIATSTAERIILDQSLITPRPTMTPLPECQDFIVIVPSAIVRAGPSTSSDIVESLPEGEIVCVIERYSNEDWYVIDSRPITRRIETAYMFHNIIEALNPTPTPSDTYTPAPSVTPLPTNTNTITPEIVTTNTPDPDATDPPATIPPPSSTPNVQGI